MTATCLPAALSISATFLVVWLLPQPVRTAQTDMTGLEDCIMVCSPPNNLKWAPTAST